MMMFLGNLGYVAIAVIGLSEFGRHLPDSQLGLGAKALRAVRPDLIYVSHKGFLAGPYEERTALDEVVQMMGGLAYMTGPPGRPLRAGASVNLVERLIGGDMTLAIAHQEPLGRYDLENVGTFARAQGDIWELTGDKAVVPQLGSADAILVTARIEGASETQAIGLFLVEPGTTGVDIRDYPLIDGGRAGELGLHAAPARLLARDALPLVEDAVAAGLVALCWEAVGVMSVLRDATLDYLRTRQQFGAPIGKFQALQHRMATVALEIEQARSAAINAAAALEGPRDARERSASAAKYTIGRVGTLVAEEAIQMHGGIGMTWELPVSHYAKRLTLIGHQLGDEDHHLERFITLGRAA